MSMGVVSVTCDWLFIVVNFQTLVKECDVKREGGQKVDVIATSRSVK